MSEFIRVESKEQIAVVTIDRQDKLNALNAQVVEELGSVMARVGADAEVRGVILTGAGEKAFVAGADIGVLAKMDPQAGVEISRQGQRVFAEIERLGATKAYIVGGTGVVSAQVESELAGVVDVERVAGADRFETARQVVRVSKGLLADEGAALDDRAHRLDEQPGGIPGHAIEGEGRFQFRAGEREQTRLHGTVTCKSFSIKTRYGDLKLPLEKVAAIATFGRRMDILPGVCPWLSG